MKNLKPKKWWVVADDDSNDLDIEEHGPFDSEEAALESAQAACEAYDGKFHVVQAVLTVELPQVKPALKITRYK